LGAGEKARRKEGKMVFGKYGIDIEERVNYDRLRTERLQRARDQIIKDGLGALVTWDADTIRYITAHNLTTPVRPLQSQFCVLPRNGDPILFANHPGKALRERMPWLKDKIFAPTMSRPKLARTKADVAPLVDTIGKILAEHGLTKEPLGLDGSTAEMILNEAFKDAGINCVHATPAMLEARKIKTQDEIELMRITCADAEPVFAAIKDAIRPGIRECDIVGLAMKLLYEMGHEHTEGLVCSAGEHTNPMDVSFTDRPIRPGELVYVDVDGAAYQGYRQCVYRTFCCGRATAEQKELYEECRAMLYGGMSAVKAGNTTMDVCEHWPDSPAYWGYELWEDVGALAVAHGIGISLHELPFFSYPRAKANPVTLEEGMVIALETWTGKRGGKDGVRLEEDVLVTKDGYELLTKFPIDEITECWT
jgi:Xaa-Pro dipeptidase